MTDRELMQMALDALESSRVFVTSREQIKHPEGTEWYDERIEALRARLAGWEKLNMNDHKEGDLGIGTVKWDASAPLVVHPHPAFQATQPQEWKGLTEDDAIELLPVMPYEYEVDVEMILEFTKAIEAKLKEKNHG